MRPKDGSAREHAREEMQEMFGFVPSFYETMPESAFASAWSLERDLEMSETALDNKTKELIGLAVASHIKCRYCIEFHGKAARAFGASDNEMREAVAMGGLTVLYSNAITGAQTDFEKFRSEVDRALSHMMSKMKQGEGARPRT